MYERIVVVTKRTPYEELLVRHNTRAQASFFLKSRGETLDEYDAGHVSYTRSIELVSAALPRDIPHVVIEQRNVPTFLFRPRDLIIACGPDGLFVNVAKYLDAQPTLAVNPDPHRIDGVVARHRAEQIQEVLKDVLAGDRDTQGIVLAEVATNDGQRMYAVNDFLIGRRDQTSSRYSIEHSGVRERQSSSGILVSTGLGSSGWMRSILTMVQGIGGSSEHAENCIPRWEDERLLFAVREPFPSRYTETSIIFGIITREEPLVVTSEMATGGVIFSDGVPSDAIEFNAGCVATISVADKQAKLFR